MKLLLLWLLLLRLLLMEILHQFGRALFNRSVDFREESRAPPKKKSSGAVLSLSKRTGVFITCACMVMLSKGKKADSTIAYVLHGVLPSIAATTVLD